MRESSNPNRPIKDSEIFKNLMRDKNLDKLALKELIKKSFDKGELKSLCFRLENKCPDLGQIYEDLGGRTLEEKVLELIQYCDRRNILKELLESIQEERPHQFKEDEVRRHFEKVIQYYEEAKKIVISISTPTIIINLSVPTLESDRDKANSLINKLATLSDVSRDSLEIRNIAIKDGKLRLTLRAPREILRKIEYTINNQSQEFSDIEIESSEISDPPVYIKLKVSYFAQYLIEAHHDNSFDYENFKKDYERKLLEIPFILQIAVQEYPQNPTVSSTTLELLDQETHGLMKEPERKEIIEKEQEKNSGKIQVRNQKNSSTKNSRSNLNKNTN